MSSCQDVPKLQVWAERLERHRASGLTVARFCASEGVSVQTFYYWARRVGTGSTAKSSSPRPRIRPAALRHAPKGQAPRGHAPAAGMDAAVETAPPAVVRFRFSAAVEVSVPADCLDAIRCLANCVQQAREERSAAFQEVVVATR